MMQVLQSLATGTTEVADVPCPALGSGQLLVRTHSSLISTGTERMLVAFGRASLFAKAWQQPDQVRQVLDKVRADGLLPTLAAVRHKLDQPLSLGYCNVGTVLEVGAGVEGLAPGDRVVSNGRHAQVVAVPRNLCVKVPAEVTDEAAAFTVVGAVALQGVRLARPTLGEAVVVSGLGLIGLLAVQLLRAHGCRVLGIDLDPQRCALARDLGAEVVDLTVGGDPLAAAAAFSRGRGVDAVVIAAATRSSEPVHQAARMCRKRGRIVLVGVTGLTLARADFYDKELSFQVSCSYGPGRYDPDYEERGRDYPAGYVRWTAQRNFEAVLDMLADGRLTVAPLVSHRFPIEQAAQAYQLVAGGAPSLGILLGYPAPAPGLRRPTVRLRPPRAAAGRAVVAFVGAGNYATATLIPAFAATGARLKSVVSHGGVSGLYAGRKYGFEETTTDLERVLADPEVDTLVVATRHDSHAPLVCRALAAGKRVFVEKPLAVDEAGLAAVAAALERGPGPLLTVGFNRRFAPQVRVMRELLGPLTAPKVLVMTVNAGALPPGHWGADPRMGGGRLVGEACHFVDLLRHLAGAPIEGFHVACAARAEDLASVILTFADGSTGTLHYLANGHKSLPKERLEVFCGGRVLLLDNFRRLSGHGWPGWRRLRLWRQDKGQKACVGAFVRAVEQGGPAPIPFEELLEVSRVTLAVAQAARAGGTGG